SPPTELTVELRLDDSILAVTIVVMFTCLFVAQSQ
ncbi:unnamed protein product, partial [Rotaria magnacalcarata]